MRPPFTLGPVTIVCDEAATTTRGVRSLFISCSVCGANAHQKVEKRFATRRWYIDAANRLARLQCDVEAHQKHDGLAP